MRKQIAERFNNSFVSKARASETNLHLISYADIELEKIG